MGFFNLKKIILVLLILLLCGCSVTYELEIKDNVIYEKSNLFVSKEKANNVEKNGVTLLEEIDFTFESFHDIENGQEENKTREFVLEKIDDINNIGLNYKNNYDFKHFSTSPIIKQCYEKVNVEINDNLILIETSNYFKCFDYYNYINDIKISLKTNYEVKKHNADEKKENTFYWYINKKNFTNKNINIEIDTNHDLIEENKKNEILINNIIYGLIIFLVIIVIIVIFKFKISNKK